MQESAPAKGHGGPVDEAAHGSLDEDEGITVVDAREPSGARLVSRSLP